MKRFLIGGALISMLAVNALPGQDVGKDRSSFLGQNVPSQKNQIRGNRLARRNLSPDRFSKLPVQASKDQQLKLTAQQQKELKKFVREHHPELIRLLNWLEKNRPEHYETAIKSLARSHNRLLMIQKRDPARFQSAVEQWKLRSRIQFAAAQLALNDSPRRRKQLQDLIRKQIEFRAQQLKQEEARLGQRLDRVRGQLERMDANLDEAVQREMRIAIRHAKRMNKGLDSVKKPGKKEKQKTKNGNGS